MSTGPDRPPEADDEIEQLHNIIHSQQHQIKELKQQVQDLQERTGWRPSRRQILKSGGVMATLLSAVGLASGAPGDDGETVLGSANNRDSYYANEIDALEISTDDLTLDGQIFYASSEAELDTALSNAPAGGTILISGTFSGTRTISQAVTIIGTGGYNSTTELNGVSWTLDTGGIHLKQFVSTGTSTFTVNGLRCSVAEAFADGSWDVQADEFRFVNNSFGSVTFASGTSNGLVDGCVRTSVTDNGTNTTGDIA